MERRASRAHPVTLLIVDDEPAVLRLLRYLLVSAGYTVMEARTEGEAIARMDASPLPVDLLLVDLERPGADHEGLIRYMRLRKPGTRVLYMSSLAADELDHVGLSVADVVEKPLGATALVRRVREVLDDPWR